MVHWESGTIQSTTVVNVKDVKELCRTSPQFTWMSQEEVSKWLVSGLEPKYIPFLSRLKPIY